MSIRLIGCTEESEGQVRTDQVLRGQVRTEKVKTDQIGTVQYIIGQPVTDQVVTVQIMIREGVKNTQRGGIDTGPVGAYRPACQAGLPGRPARLGIKYIL